MTTLREGHVFILGMGRSGSTILSRILSSQEGVLAVGEFFPGVVSQKPKLECSCGQRIDSCGYYQFLENSLNQKDWKFMIDFSRRVLNFQKVKTKLKYYPFSGLIERFQKLIFDYSDAKNYARIIGTLIEKSLMQYDCKIFLDASKQYYLLNLYFLAGYQPERLIYMTRDPKGLYASRKRSGLGSLGNFITSFRRNRLMSDRLITRYKGKVLRLSYEEFVSNPSDGLKKVMEFCDLKSNPESRSGIDHVVGNSKATHSKNLALKPDERWRTELSSSEIKALASL